MFQHASNFYFPFLKSLSVPTAVILLSTFYYVNSGNLRGIQSLFMSVGKPRQKHAKSSAYLDTLFKHYMKLKRKKVSQRPPSVPCVIKLASYIIFFFFFLFYMDWKKAHCFANQDIV